MAKASVAPSVPVSSKANDVTLFSNGIGHFRRVIDVPGKQSQKISIPFKKNHIGDVAASLQVFGKVRLDTPPSFTPQNADATALQIDQTEALSSLLTKLSGAEVKVTTTSGENTYTLLGVENHDVAGAHRPTTEQFVVLMDTLGRVSQIARRDIKNIEFKDEAVRAEIAKALKVNFQQIKPDSTFLDLELSSLEEGKDVEAQIQYTIPVAAWKMKYAIRRKDGKYTLEGAAIVDNNTDEDWNNFRISVVTGNPISFATDIAQVIVPQRKLVRLVDDVVLSNVEVEEGTQTMAMMAAPAGGGRQYSGGVRTASLQRGAKSSVSNYADFGLESAMGGELDEGYQTTHGPAAVSPGMESKDVGDFCVFTAKEPVTILARKSAVVPMFSVPLTSSGIVLLYQQKRHDRRPYRTVKFKNESEYSLGKGKTIIYDEGVFSGECVLEATKPGENRVLPHCLENGVKIVKDQKRTQSRRASVVIAKGVAIDEHVSSCETVYTIENKKDEDFKLLLEHDHNLGNDAKLTPSGVEIQETEKLTNGTRLYFSVKAKEKITLKVSEEIVNKNSITLYHQQHWLQGIIDTDQPLAKIAEDPQVKACVSVQEEINAVDEQIVDFDNELTDLDEQVDRVRSNLTAAKDVAQEKVADWVKDLGDSEDRIRLIKKTELPKLKAKQNALQTKLNDELKKIAVTWKA